MGYYTRHMPWTAGGAYADLQDNTINAEGNQMLPEQGLRVDRGPGQCYSLFDFSNKD